MSNNNYKSGQPQVERSEIPIGGGSLQKSTKYRGVVTNDLAQNDTAVAQQACNHRWKIEQVHREAKQVTGIEGCQCRLARIVRNHIGCALLV